VPPGFFTSMAPNRPSDGQTMMSERLGRVGHFAPWAITDRAHRQRSSKSSKNADRPGTALASPFVRIAGLEPWSAGILCALPDLRITRKSAILCSRTLRRRAHGLADSLPAGLGKGLSPDRWPLVRISLDLLRRQKEASVCWLAIQVRVGTSTLMTSV
jgi:hypothetical protein